MTGFAAGAVVAVDGHRDADDGDFSSRGSSRGENCDELRASAASTGPTASYENRFACVHATSPRSLHRTARLVIEGRRQRRWWAPRGVRSTRTSTAG